MIDAPQRWLNLADDLERPLKSREARVSSKGRDVPADRVRFFSPETVKGLEFDLVVLLDPDSSGDGAFGRVDRYVAMTRATRQLVILSV